jgi:hypothetical protein
MFVSSKDGYDEEEVWSIHSHRSPDLLPLGVNLWGAVKNTVFTTKTRTLLDLNHEIQLPVLLFHQQQYRNYAALSNAVINNVSVLVLVILNICDFKVSNTTMC